MSVKSETIAVIDYGSGNLRSAAKALERAARDDGLDVSLAVTSQADVVAQADRIVLPGVGAFGDCMDGLEALDGMLNALDEAVVREGRPFLGICVGMQLMATEGHEHGIHQGLGWIPGKVVALAPADPGLKIPHMGWNDIHLTETAPDVLTIFESGKAHGYFVHSYQFICDDGRHQAATTDYGAPVTAAVAYENMLGVQFHPEKSQAAGLAFLADFIRWRP